MYIIEKNNNKNNSVDVETEVVTLTGNIRLIRTIGQLSANSRPINKWKIYVDKKLTHLIYYIR